MNIYDISKIEPGKVYLDKVISSWHTTNTNPFLRFRPIVIQFTDGSKFYTEIQRW